jgi:hypothetical protein
MIGIHKYYERRMPMEYVDLYQFLAFAFGVVFTLLVEHKVWPNVKGVFTALKDKFRKE